MGAEADGTEWRGSHAFKIGRLIDPPGEELGQADVLVDTLGQSCMSEVAQDHPEFEGAETAAKRGAVVHQVRHFVVCAGSVAQVFGYQAEGSFHHVGFASVENAAIDGGEEPFMGVDDQRVGAFAACQCPAHLRVNGGGTTVGTIGMQPQAVALADSGNLGNRVDAGGRGGAYGSDDRERLPACRDIFLNGLLQLHSIHAKLAIYADFAQSLLANAQDDTRFVNRGMRLLRGIVAQARHTGSASHALLSNMQG